MFLSMVNSYLNKAPKNLIVLTLLTSRLPIFIVDIGEVVLFFFFLPDLWNNENLVFPTLGDSLFAELSSRRNVKPHNVQKLYCTTLTVISVFCRSQWSFAKTE